MKRILVILLTLILFAAYVPSYSAGTDRYKRTIIFRDGCGFTINDDNLIFGIPTGTSFFEILSRLATKNEIEFTSDTDSLYVGTGTTMTRYHSGVFSTIYWFIVLGDLSGDGKISSIDYLRIKKSFAGGFLSDKQQLAADVDKSGDVKSNDYLLVKRYFAGDNRFEQSLPEMPKNDAKYTVNPSNVFDLDNYMLPLWNSRVIYNETVFLLGEEAEAYLMYVPDEVISVYDNTLQKEYVEGVDYEIYGNMIKRLPGSSMPYIKESRYYNRTSTMHAYNDAGEIVPTYYGERDAMIGYQISVTYRHSEFWTGYNVPNQSSSFSSLISKLEKGEDVTFIFYGDSITFGMNSSYYLNSNPKAYNWAMMLTNYIAKKYGYTVHYVESIHDIPESDDVYGENGTITYINKAVAGWTTQDGINNLYNYLMNDFNTYGCDLFVQAFGMNDPGVSPADEKSLNNSLFSQVQVFTHGCPTLFVSPMPFNVECADSSNGNQKYFEPEYQALVDTLRLNGYEAACAPVYSLVRSVLEYKLYRDITGNNMNHCNDFMSRLYAQTCYQTIIGY